MYRRCQPPEPKQVANFTLVELLLGRGASAGWKCGPRAHGGLGPVLGPRPITPGSLAPSFPGCGGPTWDLPIRSPGLGHGFPVIGDLVSFFRSGDLSCLFLISGWSVVVALFPHYYTQFM